jgi:hypothetical protein
VEFLLETDEMEQKALEGLRAGIVTPYGLIQDPARAKRLFDRVCTAALANGADETRDAVEALQVVFTSLIEDERLHRATRRYLIQRVRALHVMDELNAGRTVTDAERAKARRLDAELSAEYPVKTPRYREIANRMGIKYDRVRTLMGEKRKTKPGNRGKLKRRRKEN